MKPLEITQRPALDVRTGNFTYAVPDGSSVVAWHVAFAAHDRFVAHGSELMAQERLQVAEHPILGSLREALPARGMPAVTIDAAGLPIPVTVTGRSSTRDSGVAGSLVATALR